MRKWMRERMKRRPKLPEKGKAEATQAPLQPAYFDADVAASSPSRELQEPESQSPESYPPESKAGEQESQPTQLQPPPGDANRRRRRRRGRGGRGRGGSGARAVGSSGQTQAAPPLEQNVPRTSPPQVPKAIGTVAPGASATGARPKGVVVLAIGLPGSGKSSWFKR